MKRNLSYLTVFFLVLTAPAALAQTSTPKHHKRGGTNSVAGGNDAPTVDAAADQAQMVDTYRASFIPANPWRVMNDKTNYAKGSDWVQFEGKVTAISPSGAVLQGWFGEPLCYMLPNNGGATVTSFLLSNYPGRLTAGQLLSRNDRLVAYKVGVKDDLPALDYGIVYVPTLTDDQKAQMAAAKAKKDSSVLAWHKELADKGDAYGEYKMGMRYLTGDGVDKDAAQAHELLLKAAAQGNKDAADELAKLSAAN